jgi:hypothetical protein
VKLVAAANVYALKQEAIHLLWTRRMVYPRVVWLVGILALAFQGIGVLSSLNKM